MHLEMRWHRPDGVRLPVAVWCPGPGWRMISSGVAGGGIGPREWVLNAQVAASYSRMDPAVQHLTMAGPGAPAVHTAIETEDCTSASILARK